MPKNNTEQECIPVGCVPSAAVAVCWGGCVCSWGGCLLQGVSAPGGYLPQCMLGYHTAHVDRHTGVKT